MLFRLLNYLIVFKRDEIVERHNVQHFYEHSDVHNTSTTLRLPPAHRTYVRLALSTSFKSGRQMTLGKDNLGGAHQRVTLGARMDPGRNQRALVGPVASVHQLPSGSPLAVGAGRKNLP